MYHETGTMSSKNSETEGPVLERAYRLIESHNVSRNWLYSQTCSYFSAAVAGFICAFSLRTFRNILSDSCLLNIEISIPAKEEGKGIQAVFGPTTSCDFCEFVPLVSSISALVLALFFTMSGRGGKGSPGFLTSPWRIVVPAIIFNIIALVFVTVATVMLHSGLQHFCDQLLGKELEMSGVQNNTSTTDINVNPERGFRTLTGCKVDLNMSDPLLPEQHNPLLAITPYNYALLEISQITSWCNVMSWIACVFVSLLRFICVADFHLVRFDFILVSNETGVVKPTSSSTLCTAEENSCESIPRKDLSKVSVQMERMEIRGS